MSDQHSEAVRDAVAGIAARQQKIIATGHQMLIAYNGAIYPMDLFAMGAIKRAVSTAAGFRILVESWNLLCARALLRMQIDTALRFSAAFIVSDPHEFARQVLGGSEVRKLADRHGKKMTDAYLVSLLTGEYTWLPEVYKNTSGHVHLSDHHMSSSIKSMHEESRTVQYEIHETDTKFPEFSWLEVVNCFNESTDIFRRYLQGWVTTKASPEAVMGKSGAE